MAKETEIKETGTCSICEGEYQHFGNNPEPIWPNEKRCCDRCNSLFVTPSRMGVRFKMRDIAMMAEAFNSYNDEELLRMLNLMIMLLRARDLGKSSQ